MFTVFSCYFGRRVLRPKYSYRNDEPKMEFTEGWRSKKPLNPLLGWGRECGYFVEHISILGCMGPTSILLSASILFYIVCLESKKSLQPTRVITSYSSRQSLFFYSTMFAAHAN